MYKHMNFVQQTLGVQEVYDAYDTNKAKFKLDPYEQPMWCIGPKKQTQVKILKCFAISGVKCGYFWTPSLTEMKTQAIFLAAHANMKNRDDVDIKHMDHIESNAFHKTKDANNAVIQAASQFNCLEFSTPSVTPEAGVAVYQYDKTQGPACAIACPAGTVWRNYFANMLNGTSGQTKHNQINTLFDFEQKIHDFAVQKGLATQLETKHYWTVKNGYIESSEEQLRILNTLLESLTPSQLDELKGTLRIGVQWKTDVWMPDGKHQPVTQTYCSAISIAYSTVNPQSLWAPLAKLILEATYELTMWTTVWNNAQLVLANEISVTNLRPCFLTKVGGGVFGNDPKWICTAINKGAKVIKDAKFPLDIRITHYGQIESAYVNT